MRRTGIVRATRSVASPSPAAPSPAAPSPAALSLAALSLAALSVVGCTGPPPGPAAAPTRPPPTTVAPLRPAPTTPATLGVSVSCWQIAGQQPPAGEEVVLDVVALPTRRNLGGIQVAPRPGWGLSLKYGLYVRAEAAVDILVAPAAIGRARIGWGTSGETGTHVRVPGCPPETGWLNFPGGYEVTEPMCVPLIVRSGGREARVGIGVGVACG